jgi:hypothetical protein
VTGFLVDRLLRKTHAAATKLMGLFYRPHLPALIHPSAARNLASDSFGFTRVSGRGDPLCWGRLTSAGTWSGTP